MTATAGLVFLIFEPYALLSAEEFVQALQLEAEHYRTGHGTHSSEPGLPHLLFQLEAWRTGLGWVPSALLLLGIVRGLVSRSRTVLLLLLFPMLSLGFMCMQRTNFSRNLVPALTCLVPFVGVGYTVLEAFMGQAAHWLTTRWQQRRSLSFAAHPWVARGATAMLVAASVVGWSKARPDGDLAVSEPDSRQTLAAWLAARKARTGCRVLVPRQLAVNPAAIIGPCHLEVFDVTPAMSEEELARQLAGLAGGVTTYLCLPRWRDEGARFAALRDLLSLGRPLLEAGYARLSLQPQRLYGDPYLAVYAFTPTKLVFQ